MPIHTQLYTGNLICLSPIDHENDPAVAARWTDDSDYGRGLGSQPARPLSIARLKKKFEAIEKEMEEDKNCFYFTIRRRSADPAENDRLVGFARLSWIEWNIGVGRLQLGIGQADDRRRGYGSPGFLTGLFFSSMMKQL